jgi:hypothetical protein
MRVFFLINKLIGGKNFGKSKDFLASAISNKKRSLLKLRKRNIKNISSFNVHLGNSKKNLIRRGSLTSSKKIYNSYFIRVNKISKSRFFNLNLKLNSFSKDNFYLNSLIGSKKKKIYSYIKYFKNVLPIRFNINELLFYENSFIFKSNFSLLNKYSYGFKKNELNFLYNNNFYENDSVDFFYNKLNYNNVFNIILDSNVNSFSKDSSYLKELDEKSFLYSSLFSRRVSFESNDLSSYFKLKSNFLFFYTFNKKYFNLKNTLIPFNYDNDFVYKYIRSKGKTFFLSYFSKLNSFFFNLKKNELLFKKISKKLFLKKYNMVKFNLADLISSRVNKSSFTNFIFKAPLVLKNKIEGNFFFFNNFISLISYNGYYNKYYYNKKQIFNLNYNDDFVNLINFKNYLNYSYSKNIKYINNFFIFFMTSFSKIKYLSLFHKLFFDLMFVFNFNKFFTSKQELELLNLNYFFNSYLSYKSYMTRIRGNNFLFFKFFKSQKPMLFSFLHSNSFIKTNYISLNYFYFLKSFKKSFYDLTYIRFLVPTFLYKNYNFTVENVFYINFKYYFIYLFFFNLLNSIKLKSLKLNNKFNSYNLNWVNLLYID